MLVVRSLVSNTHIAKPVNLRSLIKNKLKPPSLAKEKIMSTLAFAGLSEAIDLLQTTDRILSMREQIVYRSKIARAAVARSLEPSPTNTPIVTATTTPTSTPPSTPIRKHDYYYSPPPLTPNASALDVSEAAALLGQDASLHEAMALANFASELGLSVLEASRCV
jgi:hypothetical protein